MKGFVVGSSSGRKSSSGSIGNDIYVVVVCSVTELVVVIFVEVIVVVEVEGAVVVVGVAVRLWKKTK